MKLNFLVLFVRIMSGVRGRRGGGRAGGRGGGGRGGVNLTQEDLNNLLQAAFQLGHNGGGKLTYQHLPHW